VPIFTRRERIVNLAFICSVGIGLAWLMRQYLMGQLWHFGLALLVLGIVVSRVGAVSARRQRDERHLPSSYRTSRPYALVAGAAFMTIVAFLVLSIMIDVVIPLF
jgi:hypothetical protein